MKLLSTMVFIASVFLIQMPSIGFATERAGATSRDHRLALVGGLTREAVLVSLSATHLEYRLTGTDASGGSDNTETTVQRVPLSSIAIWGRRREMQRLPQWLLRDGGVVVSNVMEVNSQAWRGGDDPLAFTSVSSLWQAARVPSSLVAGAIMQPPFAAGERDRLAFQLRKPASSDRFWLADGNVVAGELVAARAADRDSILESWQVRVRNRPVQLEHRRLRAVQLSSGAASAGGSEFVTSDDSNAFAWLGFRDGSHVGVHRMTTKDGVIRLQLRDTGWLEMSVDSFYENVCYVRPVHDNVVYLADVEPSEQRHRPFLTVTRPARRGANVLDALPRVENRIYTKSIGVSSESFLVFDLDSAAEQGQRWNWFVAEVALDDVAALNGSVDFRVFVQDREKPWREAADSGVVRGGDAPRAIRVKLRGSQRIALVVSYAERGDMSDFANWLGPRLER